MQQIAKIDCDGFAIGGLAVGEPAEVMYQMIDVVEPHMPKDKPRYLMGVGTPSNIIEAVSRGVDFFDCVMPSRNGRHGKLFTWEGTVNILNEKYQIDERPVGESYQGLPGCAGASLGRISATSLRRTRCWPCGWRCSTTSISITNSWPRSARPWTRAPSRLSGRGTAASWSAGPEGSP